MNIKVGAILFLILISLSVSAQRRKKKKKESTPVVTVIPVKSEKAPDFMPAITRQSFHEKVDKEQKVLMQSYSALNDGFNNAANNKFLDKITNSIDWAQYNIEVSKEIDNRLKFSYLNGLVTILKYVKSNWNREEGLLPNFPQAMDVFTAIAKAHAKGESLVPVIAPYNYYVANTALMPAVFKENIGYKETQRLLILKSANQFPQKSFELLQKFPEEPYADSLIKVLARKVPQQAYDFAQANNKLSYRMQNITDDKVVATIVTIARREDKGGQFYLPFIDQIVNDKITTKQIDAVKKDPAKYFKLLVKTHLDFVTRAQNGDTAMGYDGLYAVLKKKAEDDFVNKINGLHNASSGVRFACLQPLSAEELYYVAVLTDGLIYTSSYTSGVYPLMMRKIGNKGSELLKNVHFDHYRKFISQAASYNTLDNFFSTFKNKDEIASLMKMFVSNLEQVRGLEDGVDVADSYASIFETQPAMAKEMLENVQLEYKKNLKEKNQKGITVYNILQKLFLSADPANKIDLTQDLGVPPVYNIPYNSLLNEKGEVIIQVFFYGDQDGRNIFNGFLNMFNGSNWKIDTKNKQWVVIKSTKGKPVIIYANRALDETKGEDDKAQRALDNYLISTEQYPTVTIHRGHSYYAMSTIKYMASSSKIVFMGSCGGFNLIDAILQVSDDAHIIASKQIGRTSINKPFFNILIEKLRNGNDIDWISFWKEFKQKARVDGFEDYVPPYKNLGAIFIKAYKKNAAQLMD